MYRQTTEVHKSSKKKGIMKDWNNGKTSKEKLLEDESLEDWNDG
jgi:hypothetical protein